jgi:hypothetical protein
MAKSNSTIGTTINDEGHIVFTVKGCEPFTFVPGSAHPLMQARAELHGWIQRISDGGALSRDPATGLPATPEAKRARMLAIATHYASGSDDWAMKKVGGKKAKTFDVGLVVMGMIRAGLTNDPDEANNLIARIMAKRELDRESAAKVWAETKEVAGAIAAIEAEKAPNGAEDLLAELEEEGENEAE